MLNFAIFLQTTGLSDFLGKSNVIFSSSPQASASTATSHKAPSPTPGNVSLHIKGAFTQITRLGCIYIRAKAKATSLPLGS